MDSDDEFMSGLSSQEEAFGGTQDSDDGSLDDGAYFTIKIKVLITNSSLTCAFLLQNLMTMMSQTMGFHRIKTS